MRRRPVATTTDTDTAWYRQLHWQILIGLILALIYAFAIRAMVDIPTITAVDGGAQAVVAGAIEQGQLRAGRMAELSAWRAPFEFIGGLFIRLLKLIIIPLILTSVITGILRLKDPSELGRIGLMTVGYYMGTTLMAVVVGLLVVNALDPGVGLNLTVAGEPELRPTPLADVFTNIVPTNVFGAFSAGDMLPTIFVAIVGGLALLSMRDRAVPLIDVIESANELILLITDWIMRTAPLGVAALFVATLLDPQLVDLAQFFSDLGLYMLAVVGGLSIHAVVVLPLFLVLLARYSPIRYFQALSPALLTAFSTASSSATFPVTLDAVTDRAKVNEKAGDFVLPLGATINMDGTALYEAVAAIFIANALGIELGFAQQVIIVLTATLAAIGAAGVPSAGLVTMIIVLESVGLPAAGYGLVVAVDRILDQCRTTVNVWGDAVGAAVVGRFIDRSEGVAEPPQP